MMRSSHGMTPKPGALARALCTASTRTPSGLLLVALSANMERTLGAAFEARSIGKWYLAQASAPLPGDAREGAERHRITLPLRPGRKGRMRVAGLREAIQHRPQGGVWVHEMPPTMEQPRKQAPSPSRATWAGNAISCVYTRGVLTKYGCTLPGSERR